MKSDKKVRIGQGFKRSINILEDQSNKSILENYIFPASLEQIFSSMIQHIKMGQSSFTWTGPYGAGKSSLALFMGALASGDIDLYKIASKQLSTHKDEVTSFLPANSTRHILPIIGRLEDPVKTFSKALNLDEDIDVIFEKLISLAKESDGLIVFVDEMGKFLEQASVKSDTDVYFFQQLAELANRSKGKIVLVGILHQSFAEYSRNLPKYSRDEWIKIQGRFIDFSVNAAGEEQIELISQALISKEKPKNILQSVSDIAMLIVKNRPVDQLYLEHSLNKCWPLHPIVSTLLGPVSRKRFGQNQRSIFSFLSSAEPFGLQYFLKNTEFSKNICYTPTMYWDYLHANLESAIIASSSSKMWAVAVDSLNKFSVRGNDHSSISVLKTISVIDLFKGNSGLSVTINALKSVFPEDTLENTLDQLQKLSLIRFNKYSESFSLYEGSDFDIDDAVNEAYKYITDIDFKKLHQIASLLPIVAKRHYHSTGALRWMDIRLVPVAIATSETEECSTNSFATFSMIIAKSEGDYKKARNFIKSSPTSRNPKVLSLSSEFKKLFEFSRELLALEWIQKNSSELSGDRIARKEVENRCSLVSSLLGQTLEKAIHKEVWYKDGVSIGTLTALQMSSLSSDLADKIFYDSPILRIEMLNRSKPSGSANGALNALLKRMILNKGEERLGIHGYPAEGSLFKILLEDTGLYSKVASKWEYTAPKGDLFKLSKLWKFTDDVLISCKNNFSLKTLYQKWSLPPFGIKRGLHSFLATSYLLTKKGHVATYLNGTYIPEVDGLFIDYLVKNTVDISLRYVSNDRDKESLLFEIAKSLSKNNTLTLDLHPSSSALEVSREIVKLVDTLNPWVLRTRTLSSKTSKLRELIKTAHDPNKLIFDDIASLYKLYEDLGSGINALVLALTELRSAYPKLLERLRLLILSELQVGIHSKATAQRLRERAKAVRHASGDFRIDALAARLSTFDQTQTDIAGIASLAANKPIHDWIDLDADRACLEIAVLCGGFKKAELYARIKGKKPNRHAITFASGLSGDDSVYEVSFDVLEDNRPCIEGIKIKLQSLLEGESDDPLLTLAAITELSVDYIEKIRAQRLVNEGTSK